MNPAGFRHGRIAMNLSVSLGAYVMEHDLGVVCTAETGFRLADDHVRAPDLGFVRKERCLEVGDPDGYWPGAPDLAVEVISPNDRYTEVEEKAADWIRAGSRMVLLVNPDLGTVAVYRGLSDICVLGREDVLDGGDVIDGWQVPVSRIFTGPAV